MALVSYLKKPLPNPSHKDLLLFSPKSFIVLPLLFECAIYFGLILLWFEVAVVSGVLKTTISRIYQKDSEH